MVKLILITFVYCILSIHSIWYLVKLYSRKFKTTPPDWMAIIAVILPIVAHIATYIAFKVPTVEPYKEIEDDVFDNSELTTNTGFICSRSKKDIYVGDTILFEEMLGAGTRVATCEATVKLDNTCKGYYVDGFFMDGGDRILFQWKLLEDFYSNIRLA